MSLNDSSLFPAPTTRLYLYSKGDDLVLWQDVESHAAVAKQKGYDVRTELFDGSQHVGHVMLDRDRYWNTVKRVIES